MSSEQDFLESLSPKVLVRLLSYLETRDLLTCCCVSRTWNKLVSSCETVWYRACCNIGLTLGEEKAKTAKQWKRLLIQMTLRKQQMRTSACFEEKSYSFTRLQSPVIHYHAGKIVLESSKMKLGMWSIQRNICVQKFPVFSGSAVTSVKKGDSYLAATSDRGFIACWDLAMGFRVLTYKHPQSLEVSYDFLDDYNIFVAGFEDHRLKAWDMPNGIELWSVTDHNSPVENVLLAPKTNDGRKITLWLFTMDKDYIIARNVSFETRQNTIYRFRVKTIARIPLRSTGRSTTEPRKLVTPSILFHEKFLYFFKGQQNAIYRWDSEKCAVKSEIRLDVRVKTLLGVGKKYMAFIGTERDENVLYFFVIDKETEEIVVKCETPEELYRYSYGYKKYKNPLCLGDAEWLDGLNGENDRGVLYVCARGFKSPYVLHWKPRSD